MRPEDWDIWKRVVSTVRRRGGPPVPVAPALHVQVRPPLPSSILDLHGMTLQRAHSAFERFVTDVAGHHKSAIIITGRSGQIRREFPAWAALNPRIRSSIMMHNQGSFKVTIK